MADTNIQWTDKVWNPVTGCSRVSPGCAHCYALTLAARLKAMGSPRYQRDGDPKTSGPGFGVTLHYDKLEEPLRWTKPRRIFVNSMSDLFHEDVPDGFIERVFGVMAAAKQHTFQVLTKRPDRMRDFLKHSLREAWVRLLVRERTGQSVYGAVPGWQWPLPNVWLGTSVENQHWADVRIPDLLTTPAAVRFLSCEPLLGPVRLFGDPEAPGPADVQDGYSIPTDYGTGIEYDVNVYPGVDWVIVGGESGPHHRQMDPAWAIALRDECQNTDVAFFFKQHGGRTPKAGGDLLDGRAYQEFPT